MPAGCARRSAHASAWPRRCCGRHCPVLRPRSTRRSSASRASTRLFFGGLLRGGRVFGALFLERLLVRSSLLGSGLFGGRLRRRLLFRLDALGVFALLQFLRGLLAPVPAFCCCSSARRSASLRSISAGSGLGGPCSSTGGGSGSGAGSGTGSGRWRRGFGFGRDAFQRALVDHRGFDGERRHRRRHCVSR